VASNLIIPVEYAGKRKLLMNHKIDGNKEKEHSDRIIEQPKYKNRVDSM
jgi:hypothetical protein